MTVCQTKWKSNAWLHMYTGSLCFHSKKSYEIFERKRNGSAVTNLFEHNFQRLLSWTLNVIFSRNIFTNGMCFIDRDDRITAL